MTSVPSESKLTNMVRSPRRHEASAKAPLKVVLAVPGKPVISTLAPPPRSGAEPVFEMLNLGNLLEMLACESTQQKHPVWERVNFVVRMPRSIRLRLRPGRLGFPLGRIRTAPVG